MTAEILAAGGAALLSLAFAYIPGLRTWFSSKEGTAKRLVMAAALLIVAGVAFGLACWQPDRMTDLVCSETGLLDLAWLYILALMANQGVYSIAVK